jgi:hypothetical protein
VSADSEFTPIGITTGIKWSELFDELKSLAERLKKYREGRETLKKWKEFVFANTYHANDEEEGEEDDEFKLLQKEFDGMSAHPSNQALTEIFSF